MKILFLFIMIPTILHAAAETKRSGEATSSPAAASSSSPSLSLKAHARLLGNHIGAKFQTLEIIARHQIDKGDFEPFFERMPAILNMQRVGYAQKGDVAGNIPRSLYFQHALPSTRKHLLLILKNPAAGERLRAINRFVSYGMAASLADLKAGAYHIQRVYESTCPVTELLRKNDIVFEQLEDDLLMAMFKQEDKANLWKTSPASRIPAATPAKKPHA